MQFELRGWKFSDLESLVKHANNYEVARFMTDQFPHPYTEEKGKSFIEMAMNMDPQRFFAIDIDGQACGGIGIHPQQDIMRKNAELGYWLAQPFWGNGIITRAIPQVVEYGFKTFDITRIFARPFGTNARSKRALEKCGFIYETTFTKTIYKNGEFIDELFYAVRK